MKWSHNKIVFINIFYGKVAPELISLDRDALAAVDVPTMQDKVKNLPSKENKEFRHRETFITVAGGGEKQEAVCEAKQH